MQAWLAMDTWLVSLLSLGYLGLLFVVAYRGEKQPASQWRSRPFIYSLSLGVSCTSWAFYGTVGQAATTGYVIAPVYIGTIFTLVLAWPLLLKILKISKQQNITSIADFIACRYGRSARIARLVTLVALVGTIPYIAQQLRAVSASFNLLTGTHQSGSQTIVAVTLVLTVFSILFGTRQLAASKQNQGLVLAIAFSSVVKLLAFLCVGIFVTYVMFDGFISLSALPSGQSLSDSGAASGEYGFYPALSQAILGAITILVLPRQFHMMIIENHHSDELKSARYYFPLYLLLINLFVLPIAIAGQLTFSQAEVSADSYVLTLPLIAGQAWLGVVAYLGGLAAAASMVIVATIVLSTMVANEIVNPLLLKLEGLKLEASPSQGLKLLGLTLKPGLVFLMRRFMPHSGGSLLLIRRVAIVVILCLALFFERLISQQDTLASFGLLSFVLMAQLAPLIIGALYWRKATKSAALTALAAGSLLWSYTLLLPGVFDGNPFMVHWLEDGPLGIKWLAPQSLFSLELDAISHGLLVSLFANGLIFILMSRYGRRSVGEKLQADVFLDKSPSMPKMKLTIADLANLLRRFVGQQASDDFLSSIEKKHALVKPASDFLVARVRVQLAGVLGSASTRLVMKAAVQSQEMPLEAVANIVDEANEVLRFNRELLQAGIESINQGISVIDADMRLVAWNQRYLELMDYPPGLVSVGKPVAELLRFNAGRGVIPTSDIDGMIVRRLDYMRRGCRHYHQRIWSNGIVLEIQGQAMPGKGFVTTFSDITEHVNAKKALKESNELLEKRVEKRTEQLALAKLEAERANQSKTRFLAAASHDLMQPFNALSLYASMLKQKAQGSDFADIAENISDSLVSAEMLLSDLVEISKLDGGAYKTCYSVFPLNEVLAPLVKEFILLSQDRGVLFHYQPTSCYVYSDKKLLRRIIQNFLTNAVNYCRQGKVVLGVRRQGEFISLQVWDNGPGIARDKQQVIFKEFERINDSQDSPGLGLGLAICDRIARLLGLSIDLHSLVGHGTCFKLRLPKAKAPELVLSARAEEGDNLAQEMAVEQSTFPEPSVGRNSQKRGGNIVPLHGSHKQEQILIIDNDPQVLQAMLSLLESWGYQVIAVENKGQLETALSNSPDRCVAPILVIADYHLSEGDNGVDLTRELLAARQWPISCIINSADPGEAVRAHVIEAGYRFIRKPIKAMALKRLIKELKALSGELKHRAID
ncbi:PAS domain-containing hybrid sensor histidine kinase/response regulator [Thalassomonas haliotis]|uniref:histidine kinase n=1 Tax=Thalassomonas haliotis TaxID=485448 RepID=A0ABY7VJ03_9GAMM|nr:PAS domain-containing hybrid sensor histidine kinase/response regulator [Thalassomonas haliotis]WDE13446.1 hybrid sensor histidine kinase/response regulator [Thalassomonas haliotis]